MSGRETRICPVVGGVWVRLSPGARYGRDTSVQDDPEISVEIASPSDPTMAVRVVISDPALALALGEALVAAARRAAARESQTAGGEPAQPTAE